MRYFLILLAISAIAFPILAKADNNVSDEVLQIQKKIAEQGLHWTAGQTSMMNLPLEERHRRLGLIIPEEELRHFAELNSQPPPTLLNTESYFDWRDLGGVTPVTDQGGCGSCWDFAATASFESAYLIATGDTLDLSEQQVLSCNTGGSGCGGGWMHDAYNLFRDYGAVFETCMPYQANDQIPCTQDECEIAATLLTYDDIPDDVNAIKNALMLGPLSTTFTVYDDFYSYHGGCYEHPGNDPINHAVLIIGWNDDMCDGQGAWIVKNSWGPNWGDHGFFYIKYGSASFGQYTQRAVFRPSGLPRINYDPTSISVTIPRDSSVTNFLHISNVGDDYLSYCIYTTLPNPERYDSYGYHWNDSDSSSGPQYSWKDITTLVPPIQFMSPDNSNSGNLSLGFNFTLYGSTYSTIRFCTNGWASFMNSPLTQWNNTDLPDISLPNKLLAAFWDDLTLQYGGAAYFYTNHADSAIITWDHVRDTRQEGVFTFQIILVVPDTIVYQYASMGPQRLDESTVGIENGNGTIGLRVTYNSPYVHDELATEFYFSSIPTLGWIQLDHNSGSLPAQGDTTITISLNATQLNSGTYRANLRLMANDQDSLENDIPVAMTVVPPPCQYVDGDINGDGRANGLDVLYGVRYLRGQVFPLNLCDCLGHGLLYVAGDVNNSCSFNGIDITFIVNRLKGGPEFMPCQDCPPSGR